MRKITRNRKSAALTIIAAASSLALVQQAHGQTLYWDANGTTTGAGTSGGTWNTGSNWTTDALNGSTATVAWADGNTADFAAGRDTTGTSYPVTIAAGTVSVLGVSTVPGGAFTATSGTVTFAGTTGSSFLNLSGATPTFTLPKNLLIGSSVGLTGTAGFTKASAGTLTINSNNASSLSGNVAVLGGSVVVGNAGAFGSGAIAFDPTNTGGQITVGNGLTVPNALTITGGSASTSVGQLVVAAGAGNAATWSGNVTIGGTTTGGGAATTSTIAPTTGTTLTITGQIGNNGAGNGGWWKKAGTGTLVLDPSDPAGNTFAGTIRHYDGFLVVQTDNALGSGGVYLQNTGNGAVGHTLAFQAPGASTGFTYNGLPGASGVPYVLDIVSVGMPGFGTIDNLGGANTFTGNISFNNPGTVGVSVGSLELAGGVYGAGSGFRSLTKLGNGELIISSGTNNGSDGPTGGGGFQGDSGWVGQYSNGTGFYVNAGTLTVANGGLLNVPVIVQPGGTFKIDESRATFNWNPFTQNANGAGNTSSGVGVHLISSRFLLNGNATNATSYNFAPAVGTGSDGSSTLTLTGNSYMAVQANGAETDLDIGNPSRSNGQTLVLQGIGQPNVTFSSSANTIGGGDGAGTTDISIIPFMVGDSSISGTGTDFVTSDSTTHVVRMLAAGEYASSLSSLVTNNDNVSISGNQTVAGPLSINAMKFSGAVGPNVTISSGTLTMNASALLDIATGTSTITGGSLQLNNEGIINVSNGNTLTINSTVMASNGITKSGLGTATFGDTSNVTGNVTVNEGTLVFNILNDSAPLTMGGGTFRLTQAQNTNASINIAAVAGTPTIDVSQNTTFSGSVNDALGSTVVGWFKAGAGTLTLGGGQQDHVNLTIQNGTVAVPDDGHISPSPSAGGGGFVQILTGGQLEFTGSTTMLHNLLMPTTSTTLGIMVDNGQTVQFGDGGFTAVTMSGPGNFVKNGGGTWEFLPYPTQSNGYAAIVINGGTVQFDDYHPVAGSGSAWVTINNGATLQFNTGCVNQLGFMSNSTRGITVNGNATINVGLDFSNNVPVILEQAGGIFGTTAGSVIHKAGPSTLLLKAPTTAGNYNGLWSVDAGTLLVQSDTALGATPASVVANDITIADGATFGSGFLNNTGVQTNNATGFTVSANRGIMLTGGSPTIRTDDIIASANSATTYTGTAVTVTYAGKIGGAATNLIFAGTGTTVLTGTSNFTGNVILNGGSTALAVTQNIGIGPTFIPQTVTPTAGAVTAANTLRIGAGPNALPTSAVLYMNTGGAGNGFSAVLDLAGSGQTFAGLINSGPSGALPTVTGSTNTLRNLGIANNFDETWDGNLTGSINLSKSGSGLLVLGVNPGPNPNTISYFGGTTVGGGTLNISSNNMLPSTTSLVLNSINSGTPLFDLQGFNQSVAAFTLSAGTMAGSAGGVLTTNNINLQAGTASVILAGTGGATKSTTGTAILTGANTYTGNNTISGGTLVADDANLGAAANNIVMDGGTLKGNTGLNTSRTVTVNATGGAFDGSNGFTLGGTGNSTLNGNLTVAAGTVTINRSGGVVSVGAGAALTVNTGATLNLQGVAITSAGGNNALINDNGIVNVSSNHTIRAIRGSGSLAVNGGRVAIAPTLVSGNAVGVKGDNAGTSVLSALSIATGAGASMDLGNHSLIVNYTPGNSPATTIKGYLANAYNAGAWNQPGLTSSVAAADTNGNTALGYAEASDLGLDNGHGSFAGQTVAGEAVLVKYTYYGDSNLDGVVNLDDFSIFIDGFNHLGSGWIYGDYNYDGNIDQADFAKFVQGYNITANNGPSLSQLILSDSELSASQKSALLSVVPEPTSLGIFAISAGAMAMRRRRKA